MIAPLRRPFPDRYSMSPIFNNDAAESNDTVPEATADPSEEPKKVMHLGRELGQDEEVGYGYGTGTLSTGQPQATPVRAMGWRDRNFFFFWILVVLT